MTDSNRPPLTFAFFPEVATFEVSSDDIADGATLANAQVANFMGYSGENLSPQLSWSGFPAETKSFAVTVHDPDAPTGSGFWHWLALNIPPDVSEFASGASSTGPCAASRRLRNGVVAAACGCGFTASLIICWVRRNSCCAMNDEGSVISAFWNSARASSSLPASRKICARCTSDAAARNRVRS